MKMMKKWSRTRSNYANLLQCQMDSNNATFRSDAQKRKKRNEKRKKNQKNKNDKTELKFVN